MLFFKAGATDKTVDIFVPNSSSTTGAGLTGLVYNSASLVCYYRKGATGSATALTLATQTVGGAHSDGGFVEIDATNMPGMYRLDLSDTIIATAGHVTVHLKGATNMAPVTLRLYVGTYDASEGVNITHAAGTAWGSGAITAGSIAADAITAAKVASDVSAEIADAVWDEDATGHQTQGTFGQAIGDPVADTNTIFKAVVTDATGATVGADTAAILDDTGTTGVPISTGGIAATSFAAGAIDAAAIAAAAITSSEAPNLDAAISTRATPAQVNTEVLDVLNVDTFAEPGQEVPPATTTLVKKIGYIYKFLRNRITQTATTLSVYADDATTVDQKATVSDNGTTYDRGEIASGP